MRYLYSVIESTPSPWDSGSRIEKYITTTTSDGHTDTTPVDLVICKHTRKQNLVTKGSNKPDGLIAGEQGVCVEERMKKRQGGVIRNIVYYPLMVIFTIKLIMHICVAISL